MAILGLKSIVAFHTGSDREFSLEHQFFNVMSFVGGLIGVFTVLINVFLGLGPKLVIITSFVTVFCWGVFYLTRFAGHFLLGKWLLTTLIFGIFTYFFFINNGSHGPVLYLYMAFLLLILFIWDGWGRIFFIGVYFLNILGFYLIETHYAEMIAPYTSEQTRLYDLYLSYFMYVVLLIIIMAFIKQGYRKAKEKAEEADRLKSAFLANMSHEIRTPMNAILGFTQLLEENVRPEKRDFYISVINENGQNLLRLIDDIIDVSKIEAGELEIKEVDCDLGSLLDKLTVTFEKEVREHPEKQVVIRQESDPPGLMIRGDDARIRQVLINLIHNAIKYTDEGEVRFGYLLEQGQVKFFVRDTGCGFDKEQSERIFDRFMKIETDNSVKVQPGTGIGLSISKNLVNLMGGQISVNSTPGEGSEFFFTIPYRESAVRKSDSAGPVNFGMERVNLSGRKILVAEDDPTNFFFINKVLQRYGAEVMHARTGREAVELFANETDTDLVLMDILMPEMNGYEATRELKKLRPEIPVIAQTALAMEGDEAQVMESGCDDYISKPIRVHTLLSKIILLLEKASKVA